MIKNFQIFPDVIAILITSYASVPKDICGFCKLNYGKNFFINHPNKYLPLSCYACKTMGCKNGYQTMYTKIQAKNTYPNLKHSVYTMLDRKVCFLFFFWNMDFFFYIFFLSLWMKFT